jgi:RNA-directed DNA polymerase
LKINVIRYADDFVITADSPEILEKEVRPWVEQFLALRGLELAEEKTRIVSIDQGFDFLGWNFRKYGEKLLIKPSQKNVRALYSKVREIIQRHHGGGQDHLIYRLNPVLRGWALYHQPVVAKATFHRLDAKIWYLLWRWARRRHQNKGAQWVRKRYFHTLGDRRWEFAYEQRDTKSGHTRYVRLDPLSVTPIQRHAKIKGDYNPFDPAWEREGEMLRTRRMMNSLQYRREVARPLPATARAMCALSASNYPGVWMAGSLSPSSHSRRQENGEQSHALASRVSRSSPQPRYFHLQTGPRSGLSKGLNRMR